MYLDGAIYHNNPIVVADREQKLLWGHQRHEWPDIVLSIGTSRCQHSHRIASERAAAVRYGVVAHGRALLKIAKDHVAAGLDCDNIWSNFTNVLPGYTVCSRFVRLNPDLNEEPPALDEVDRMKPLQNTVRTQLATDGRIRRIASQLIATLFYFEPAGPLVEKNGTYLVSGTICNSSFVQRHGLTTVGLIHCRLAQNSREISELGYVLRDKANSPFFIVQEEASRPKTVQTIMIMPHVIEHMIRRHQFHMGKIEITLINKLAATEMFLYLTKDEGHPVSGFPRLLLREDDSHAST